jgi:hypothetical protein
MELTVLDLSFFKDRYVLVQLKHPHQFFVPQRVQDKPMPAMMKLPGDDESKPLHPIPVPFLMGKVKVINDEQTVLRIADQNGMQIDVVLDGDTIMALSVVSQEQPSMIIQP